MSGAGRPDIGVSLYDHGATDTVALALAAEELGFTSVWLGEHVVVPMAPSADHPYRPQDDPPILGPESRLFDLFTVIGAIGARTQRLTVATGIYLLPLRSPVLTALAAATAQELTGGRVCLGVGSGWLPEEFEALGVPFARRGALLDEYIDVVRAALAGGAFEHHGDAVDVGPVQVTREPVALPIVIGGVTDRAVRRAALRGDGWYNPSTTSLPECVRLRGRIESLREELGRGERPFTFHIRMAGLPDQELVARYVDAGFTTLSVSGHELWPRALGLSLDDKLDRLRQLAGELGVG